MIRPQVKGQLVKMFYHGFPLERSVRKDPPLGKINELIDFDFIYKEVGKSRGQRQRIRPPSRQPQVDAPADPKQCAV